MSRKKTPFERFIEEEVLPQEEDVKFTPLNKERLEAWAEANPNPTPQEAMDALMDPKHHLYPDDAA